MHNPGCGGWDSNPRFSAYEADDLAACLPRNGCRGWIRTTVLQLMRLARSASSLLCNIQGGIFFRSEPPRPHMKGNENRNQRLVNNYKYFSVTADWKNTYSVVSLLEEVCIEIVAIHFSSLLPHRSQSMSHHRTQNPRYLIVIILVPLSGLEPLTCRV